MNSVIVTGRLTHDPELKKFESGNFVSFTLAVDNWKSTVFINCSVYGEKADLINKTLRKGNLIAVQGRLEQRTYETQTGEKRVITYIALETFDYLEKKETEEPQKKSQTPEEMYRELSDDQKDGLPF